MFLAAHANLVLTRWARKVAAEIGWWFGAVAGGHLCRAARSFVSGTLKLARDGGHAIARKQDVRPR